MRGGSPGATNVCHRSEPFVASMGIYVFSRRVLLDILERESGVDFGRELIPNALAKYREYAFADGGYLDNKPFSHATEELARIGRVITYDRRGYGRSAPVELARHAAGVVAGQRVEAPVVAPHRPAEPGQVRVEVHVLLADHRHAGRAQAAGEQVERRARRHEHAGRRLDVLVRPAAGLNEKWRPLGRLFGNFQRPPR